MLRQIDIDPHSGLCFGVSKAISAAEDQLKGTSQLFSLGEIVHNSKEVNRLNELGMTVVSHQELSKLDHATILFRAHGEPPESYQKAIHQNLNIVDATCPVVLKLQSRFLNAYNELIKANGQLLLFGKKVHPEVIGLLGQVGYDAILIESEVDLAMVDFNRPIELFSQTTKDVGEFRRLVETIKSKIDDPSKFFYHDTICRQVANRIPWVTEFAQNYDANW
jgi:4-hydroxy-3-methylbut-2-enyl diphosphate reductase